MSVFTDAIHSKLTGDATLQGLLGQYTDDDDPANTVYAVFDEQVPGDVDNPDEIPGSFDGPYIVIWGRRDPCAPPSGGTPTLKIIHVQSTREAIYMGRYYGGKNGTVF